MSEEPDAGILHVRVCEGGGPGIVMENLNGHEAGNGGYSQGDTYRRYRASSTRSDVSLGWLGVAGTYGATR